MSSAAHSAASGSPAKLPIWVNRSVCLLSVGGETHRVTGREARLLDLLMKVPGRAVSHESLIIEMYHDKDEPKNPRRILAIQMCRLREKLKPHVEINSVRGIGYYLGPPLHDWEVHGLYEGRGDVGRWRLSKRYAEPVLRFVSEEDPTDDLYLPLSSVGVYGFQLVEERAGR